MEQIDQLWIIIAAILVSFMQLGFLCLESGAVRRKNSINVGAKNIYDLVISIGLFFAIGHLLMFGQTEAGFIGNPWKSSFNPEDNTIILFQAMFAGTAATILSGSIAERMKFNSYILIVIALSVFIYPIIGHWVWPNVLIEDNTSWLYNLGFKDFAGCSVVHAVGGSAALAVSLVLGPRLNRFGEDAVPMRSNDYSLSFIGLLLIWIGWFGFNGGSVMAVNADLTKVIINTILGGIAGGIGGRLFKLVTRENQLNVWSMISGILGGLVGITGGAIYFSIMESLMIGLIGGFIAVAGEKMLEKYEIDDVVGAIPVHLFAGIWGILALGIWGSQVDTWSSIGLFERIGVQTGGIFAIVAYTFIIVWFISKLLNYKYGIRVSEEAEKVGLNIMEHQASTASYDLINSMNKQVNSASFDEILEVEVGTEVGEITEMYNHVVREMNRFSAEEKALKKEIQIRNNQLKFQRDVSNTLNKSKSVKEGFNKIIGPFLTECRLKGIQLFKYKSKTRKLDLLNSAWVMNGSIVNNIESKDQSWRIDQQALNYVISTLDQLNKDYDSSSSSINQSWINEEIKWSIFTPIIIKKKIVAIIVIFAGAESVRKDQGLDDLIGITKSLSYLFERETSNNKLKKAAKKAHRANEAKTNFLAMMSHEIRTPMNGVIGMSSLLQETNLDEEQKEFSDSIQESAHALLYIINDILDFTKFDSEGFKLEKIDFNLVTVIEGCLDVVSPKTRQKGIELLCQIDTNVPTFLSGDANRLRQVILNLLGNASKFTIKGEILLKVSVLEEESTKDKINLQFSIRDTGIGIKENRIEQLFESFTQADSSTKRKFGGTGLGLSISKKIVTKMNGKIWATSQLGQGSTFNFTAAFDEASDKQKLLETKKLSYQNLNQLKKKRVLIIDDNYTNRQILIGQLSNWKMSVSALASGKDIQSFLEENEAFDLILTDYQMPELCGTEVIKEIHQANLSAVPPIIMLSSVDKHIVVEDPDYEEKLLSEILLKPVKQSKFFEQVLSVVSGTIPTNLPLSAGTISNQKEEKYVNQNFAAQYPLNILIVDDNKMNRRLCSIILERAGYKADIAVDGLEALEKVSETFFDVILMDIEMPKMDGLTAMTEIRKLNHPSKNSYLICLTAAAMSGDKDRCISHGADDYLTKPINRTLLINSLIRAYQTLNNIDHETPDSNTDIMLNSDSFTEQEMYQNLKQIAGENPEIIANLISTFNDELIISSTNLDKAYADKNFAQVKQIAHSLKPNAKLFSDSNLHDQCEMLELETQKGPEGEYKSLIETVQQSIKRLQHNLQSHLEKNN